MPKFNSRGDILAGGYNSPVHVNGVVPQPIQGVVCSHACWLTDDEIIYQAERNGRFQIESLDLRTMAITIQAEGAVSHLVAGGGRWAASGHFRDKE